MWVYADDTGSRGERETRMGLRAFGNRGFTLLEIVLVLLILVVTAGIVAPVIGKRLTSGDPQQTALQIRSALTLMRVYAVQRGQPEILVVAPQNNTYWHERTGKRVEVPPENGLLSTQSQWVRQGEEGEEVEFHFYPDGTNSGGAIRVEQARDPGFLAYTVYLDPLLGTATVQREDG